MAIALGILIIPSRCREQNPQEPADCQSYEIRVRKLMKDNCIDPRAMILLEEFNDLKYLHRKKTERTESKKGTSKKERTESAGGQPVSCVLAFTPTGVARALVITDEGCQETFKLINTVLGKHVLVAKNKTSTVYSE